MVGMGMSDVNPAGLYLMNLASGTSQNPLSWLMPMVMMHLGHWNTMFMANAFVVETQQSGPRGGDKLYSTNALMASASHRAGAKGIGITLVAPAEQHDVTQIAQRLGLDHRLGGNASEHRTRSAPRASRRSRPRGRSRR